MELLHLFRRHHHRHSMVFALALSILFVVIVASLARGTIHLRGALMTPEPTDVTVIALVEPKLSTGSVIRGITFLRKSKNTPDDRGTYAYLVQDSADERYLLKINWNSIGERWGIASFERLHGSEEDVQ